MARKRPKRRQPAYKITVPSSENGEVECYSLDLDQLDLGLLPVENLLERLRSNSNRNLSVLWQTQRNSAALKGNSSTTSQDCESFTVHAVRDSPTEEDEENISSPSSRTSDLTQSCDQSTSVTLSCVQTVHCHICSLCVPEDFKTEHVQSDMHLTLLRLANTALGRLNKLTEQLIDRMTREKGSAPQMSEYKIAAESQNKTKPKACYCVPCNVVVELSLVESHESELNHINSLKRQMQLAEFCKLYTNDQAPEYKDSSSNDDLGTGNKSVNSVEKFATVNVHSSSVDIPENGNTKRSSIENLAIENTDSSALIQSLTVNSSRGITQAVGSLANCTQNETNSQKDSTNLADASSNPVEKPTGYKDVQKPLNCVFGLIKPENVQKKTDCQLKRHEKEGKVTHCESREYNEIEESHANHVRNKYYVVEHINQERNEHINNSVLKNTDNKENQEGNVASEEKSEKAKTCNNVVSVERQTFEKTSKNIAHDKSILSPQETVVTNYDKATKDSPSTSYRNAEETESSTQKNRVTKVNDSLNSEKQQKDAFPLHEMNAKQTKSTSAQATNVKPVTDILETSKQRSNKLYHCEDCLTTVPNTTKHIVDHCKGKKHKKNIDAKCAERQSNETKDPIQSSVETKNAIQLLRGNNNSVQQYIANQQSGGTNSANQQSDGTNIAIEQSKGTTSCIKKCDKINNTLLQTDETESAVQQKSKENLVQSENIAAKCDSKKKYVFSHDADDEKRGLYGSFEQLDAKHEFEVSAQLTNAETDVQTPTDADESADCTKQFFCTFCEVYLPNNANTISQHMGGKIHQNILKSMSNLITDTKPAGNVEEAGKSTDSGPDLDWPSSPSLHAKTNNKQNTRRGKRRGKTHQSENSLETCIVCPGNKNNTAEHENSLDHQMRMESLSGYLKYINFRGLAEELLQKKNILLKTQSGAELPITAANWHGVIGDEARMTYYCILCEETVGYTGFQYHEHIITLRHVKIVSQKPKQAIREIVSANDVKYHCVVCNIICDDFKMHVESLYHRTLYDRTANGRCEPNEMKTIITEDTLPATTEDSCAIT